MPDDKQHGGSGAPQEPEDEFGDFLSDAAGPKPEEGSDFGALTGGNADDAGLGNLPPLSDFESSSGMAGRQFDSGGLPPLDQIHPEVPRPTGGNVRPAPPGFEDRSAFDTPISDSGLDTPHTPSGLDTPQPPRYGTGFQDLTADSDFSPETPEIGPGPDSDLETPMFDSAFGAGGGFDRTPDTSAPTQAMETPIFGQQSGPSGFDPDAFGGGGSAGGMLGGGTPIPDFSPDTGIPGVVAPPMPSGMEVTGTGAGAAPRGGIGTGALLAIVLVVLLLGAGAGAWFSTSIPFTPANEQLAAKAQEVTSLTTENNNLQKRVNDLMAMSQGNDGKQVEISQEELDRMIAESKQLGEQLAGLQTQVTDEQNKLNLILGDIESKTQEYAEAQKDYDALMNQVSIQRARSEGLGAEVQRLEDQVGSLEEAAQRSTALKERLIANVNRLDILIQDGIALTPAKYAHEDRLQAVRSLKDQVAAAKVVTPDLLDEYTRLFQKEMEIAGSREYFFAKIPVQDRFGTVTQKWAEAVMNGNWSVYFRTLDGKSVGIYERTPGEGTTKYSFRQYLTPAVAKQIEQEVISARVPGYEEKINTLAQREVTMENKTGVQRVFDSL